MVYKCALVGYGYWGKILRNYIQPQAGFEIKYICVPKGPNADTLFIHDMDFILNDKEIKAVFVCTPMETHFEICKELLNCGKHVFCEKPLTLKMDETDALCRIAERKKVSLFTDYTYLYSNSVQKLLALSSQIGKLHYIDAEISQYGKFYNHNVFRILGVHLLSVIAMLFKNQTCYLEKVDSYISNRNHTLCGNTRLKFSDSIVDIKCSLVSNHKCRRIILYGETGTITFDMLAEKTLSFVGYNQELKIEHKAEWTFDEANNLMYVLKAFHKSIEQKKGNIEEIKNTQRLLEIVEGGL